MDALTRDARTVMVSQLQVKAEVRDIQSFFDRKCKVKEVRLLRDKSRRSKGIGYVELESIEDRNKALELDNTPFVFSDGSSGFPCLVKPSEAEKNISKAKEQKERIETARGTNRHGLGSVSIIISNMPRQLDQARLKEFCSNFGKRMLSGRSRPSIRRLLEGRLSELTMQEGVAKILYLLL
mmetsp:Transcript_16766/g.30785  ORF Transcript_16766/g.30785 Transcript_16766/m.30785 type:complete len:181 (+) Transcript_16766:368-910(+)